MDNQILENDNKESKEGSEFKQWVTFDLNNERYGIDVMSVKEVLRYSEVTEVPGSEDFVSGIINLRGNVVTVIDTRVLFDLNSKEADEDTRILVFELNGQELAGLVIDNVEEVITLNDNDIDRKSNVANDPKKQKSFVQGLCYHEEKLIILMDLPKIIERVTPEK